MEQLLAIAAAAWIIVQFLLRREAHPGAELELDVHFAGVQEGQMLVEIVATLANRGLVLHRYRNFRIIVRYLLPADRVTDGDERVAHQVYFPQCIDARVGGAHRYFSNAAYIEPRLTFRHSYVTFVPAEATFLLVQCRLDFPRLFRWLPAKKNAQRLFAMPASPRH